MDKLSQTYPTKDLIMPHIHDKPAYTLIEVTVVLMLLGILTSLTLSKAQPDLRVLAITQIITDIRHTQHLALHDHKHQFNHANWQKRFWRIGFEYCAGRTHYYEYIGSDNNKKGGIDHYESAIDPITGRRMIWSGKACPNAGDSSTASSIFITHKYGINRIKWKGSCRHAQYIGFDSLGRIHQGFASSGAKTPHYSSNLSTPCLITFDSPSFDKSFTISIAPETGYTHLVK